MIILSCGCQSGDFGIEAEWDTFSREGKPAIECGFICQKHFELYDARTSEPESQRQWVGLTDEEIEAEREACAKVVDHILKEGGGTWGDAIRARGNT